jgi:CheY-like chemotaxis protein
MHELATNCIKYGALSNGRGRVFVSWTTDGSHLDLDWRESGGPPVTQPMKRGFGTILIEQSARSEGGEARMEAGPGGVVWRLRLPLHRTEHQFYGATPSLMRTRPPQTPAGVLRGLRVLIIEDEPLVSLEIASILRDAGAEPVGPFASLASALEKSKAGGFDAAVLDGNLLGEPVDDVAVVLSAAAVPFVFISGYGRESLPKAFSHVPLLSKPFEPATLIEAVRKLTRSAAVPV